MGAGAAEPARPSVATPLDAWHVAVHEVPVGPMKREELARKIAAGAVTGESLCWREGFDDWRPLRDVAELSPLLRRPAAPTAGATRPPAPAGRALPPAGRPIPAARPGAAPTRAPASNTAQRPGAPGAGRSAAPAARSNVVPIGGRLGAAAAPVFDEQPDDFDAEPTMVAQSPLEAAERARASAPEMMALSALVTTAPMSMAPPGAPTVPAPAPSFEAHAQPMQAAPVSYSEPPRRRKPMSPGLLLAAVGAGTFGVAFAAMVFTKMFQQPQVAPAVAVVAPVAETAPQAPIVIPDAPAVPAVPAVAPVEPLAVPEAVPAPGGRTPTKRGTGAQPAAGARQLSAAEQATLDRMTGGGAGSSNLTPLTQPNGGGGAPIQAAELSADQLRAVVTRNRPGLQHCYEMAARQTGSAETMRANIEIAVGGSGVVTRVAVTGPNAPVQLTTCLEGQVRRWHFPAGGEATFPVVFSPGG